MDYRAMWETLGMDVKTHDVLCEALPGMFGSIFMSQDDRPEGMDYFYSGDFSRGRTHAHYGYSADEDAKGLRALGGRG